MAPDQVVRPLRILHINRSYPHHRAGGMENHAQCLLEGLMEQGHTLHVMTTPLPQKPALKELKPNGRLIKIGRKMATYDLHFFLQLRSAVSQICRVEDIDLIHCQGFAGIPLVLFPSRGMPPVVTSIHGTLTSETPLYRPIFSTLNLSEKLASLWKFKKRLLFLPIWRWFLHQRPTLICDSRFTIKELKRSVPSSRCNLLPLGFVDKNQGQSAKSKGYALFIGRLEKIKGADFLLDVWESDGQVNELPDLHLVGGGPEEEKLRARLNYNKLGDKIKILGRMSDQEVERQIREAGVLLNPDQGYPAFGLVNAEALTWGVPVIASPNGAHPEVILKADGSLEKHDVLRWKDIIISIIKVHYKDSRQLRSKRARRRFSRDKMIERLEIIYSKLLK